MDLLWWLLFLTLPVFLMLFTLLFVNKLKPLDEDTEKGAAMLRKAADAGIKEVRDYMYRNNIK